VVRGLVFVLGVVVICWGEREWSCVGRGVSVCFCCGMRGGGVGIRRVGGFREGD